ncbi:ACT domain-containing protein [Inediibacterium massiliense]|uniref:ACT domain-containing protein n=1 Tax=Inediibacterium massiliense TaxID=1658111 RepID=UPI0006B4130A|nr:ACT domain-containing protein [Inediibacterium massiliense]
MKAVVTVIGKDKIGIISKVTSTLAENQINVLDISQTILQDYFTMIMIVDLQKINCSFEAIQQKLSNIGEYLGVSIKIQHEEIFEAMHKISQ